MANRSFEVHDYRQVIAQYRLGRSIRQIVRSGIMGRSKASSVISVARKQGWLDLKIPVPDEKTLADFFEVHPKNNSSKITFFHYGNSEILQMQTGNCANGYLKLQETEFMEQLKKGLLIYLLS